MKIKTILLMAAAAVGGIYLTSEEGKDARKALQNKKSILLPVIKDLLKEANLILEGSREINSDEIRANVEKIVKEVKLSLTNLDLEKSIDVSRKAIKVASNKLNDISNESSKQKKTTTKSKLVTSKAEPKKATAKSSAKKAK